MTGPFTLTPQEPGCAADTRLGKGCLTVRDRKYLWGERTFLMGVVNVTPDSFSGDGLLSAEQAANKACQLAEQGADIIDIGGESTRPGHTPIDSKTEIERVVPVIERFRRRSHAVISIDTHKPEVLDAALAAGADILNSVWGLKEELLQIVAERDIPVVIMHNKSAPDYKDDVMDEVLSYLYESACRAVLAGIKPERIMLDPGIGFGKLPEHNLSILSSLSRLPALGFPTLIGTSKKSTLGKITGAEVQDRAFSTAATVALAVAAGVDVVRVHDIEDMVDVVKMSDAIIRGWRPDGWLNGQPSAHGHC